MPTPSFNRVFYGIFHTGPKAMSLTAGERHLLDVLDSRLPRDEFFDDTFPLTQYRGWLIFVQPAISCYRPDFVLFHPMRGLHVIEVKDWNLAYNSANKDHRGRFFLSYNLPGGPIDVGDPRTQVTTYRDALLSFFNHHPLAKKPIETARFSTSLYFHLSSQSDVESVFGSYSNPETCRFTGRDSVESVLLHELANVQSASSYTCWRRENNEAVINVLMPGEHHATSGEVLTMSASQIRASTPLSGHHRIRGYAGSGKTLALARRAAALAADRKSVLVLTYNITLRNYIHDLIEKAPVTFDRRFIQVTHFHGLCASMLVNLGSEWPWCGGRNQSRYLDVTVPDHICELIDRKTVPRYDAILIDEGQDYCIEWYRMLTKILSAHDELAVYSDKKQNIYGREQLWLDKRKKGTEKFTPWIELKQTIRLPRKIAQAALMFSTRYDLGESVELETSTEQTSINSFDAKIVWRNIDTNEIGSYIDRSLDYLINNYLVARWDDLTILTFGNSLAQGVVNYKEKSGMRTNNVSGSTIEEARKKKIHYRRIRDRLNVLTVHSAKGMESMNIITIITKNERISSTVHARMIYTAMTRAKRNLIVLNADPKYNEWQDVFEGL